MDLPPQTTPKDESPFRDPAKLFYQKDGLRRSIIIAYWTVIVLALPLWWYTTSIERLSLPSGRVHQQTQNHLELPITICLESADSRLIHEVKHALSSRISQDPQRWRGLAVSIAGQADCGNFTGSDVYTVVSNGGPPSIIDRRLYFPLNEANSPSTLAETLSSLLVPYSITTDPEHRVAQYSPHYRLAFSLLNEDVTAGEGVFGWNIQRALKSHISPILRRLSALHNFTIESQVQFHAPLAFTPRQLEHASGLTPEDLTVFVNSAEWTLSSSSSNDPVLHFILFIPSAQRPPLRILTKDDTLSASNAFLLPQWGGIVIHNPDITVNGELPSKDLHIIFSSFANQLLGLLGVPALPFNVKRASSESPSIISDWQLDALLRRRTLENAIGSQDTLLSIVKLVDQIENMPVGEDVRGDVEDALDALTKMYESASSSLNQTFVYSAQSLGLASRAFFSPGMLALLYFPAEHTYAVYTPLFASAVIPLFVAALREFVAWRKERKEAATAMGRPS